MHPAQKIILGTAQFGLNYGINNKTGKIPAKDVDIILRLAYKNGIETLDTAQAYGNSEKIIGDFLKNSNTNFKVISKLHPDIKHSVENHLDNSLSKLNIRQLYGFLIHKFNNFKENRGIWDEIRSLRDKGKIEKIGFSLYSIEQLEFILKKRIEIDLIQIPYNILQRNFQKYFQTLKKKGVEIHVRSVFLQGLFFMNIDKLPSKLMPLKPFLEKIHAFCNENNFSIEEFVLNYVINNPDVDGVLVGVDNKIQFENNIASIKANFPKEAISFVETFKMKKRQELLNPINWI